MDFSFRLIPRLYVRLCRLFNVVESCILQSLPAFLKYWFGVAATAYLSRHNSSLTSCHTKHNSGLILVTVTARHDFCFQVWTVMFVPWELKLGDARDKNFGTMRLRELNSQEIMPDVEVLKCHAQIITGIFRFSQNTNITLMLLHSAFKNSMESIQPHDATSHVKRLTHERQSHRYNGTYIFDLK